MDSRALTYVVICFAFVLTSCEQEFFPDTNAEDEEVVVEGYVEVGEGSLPAYIILTRTTPFFSSISQDKLNELFINGAEVTVSDGIKDVELSEICLSSLPTEIRKEIAIRFGFDPDSLTIDFCVYLDLADQLIREVGRDYQLSILSDGIFIESTTSIPEHVPLDSLRFYSPPGAHNDTLAQLLATVSDPPGIDNYYRYFIQNGDGPFEAGFSSTTDDVFFDGKSFEFQLVNAEGFDEDIDPATFGLYQIGDTITVKWCSLDKEHFDFWNTLEYSNANQGPFSSYTRIDSNVKGALGIWGGYSISLYTLVVEY